MANPWLAAIHCSILQEPDREVTTEHHHHQVLSGRWVSTFNPSKPSTTDDGAAIRTGAGAAQRFILRLCPACETFWRHTVRAELPHRRAMLVLPVIQVGTCSIGQLRLLMTHERGGQRHAAPLTSFRNEAMLLFFCAF
jgi:hypothetical protein